MGIESPTFYRTGEVTVRATVTVGIGGLPLSDVLRSRIKRTVVDTNLQLPAMFEITFDDNDGDSLTKANLAIGSEITISAGAPGDANSSTLISGEVTSIEGAYDRDTWRTVVRGYDKTHRLQRAKRTRTFLNMKDSDIVREIVMQAGLVAGVIEETRATHDHVGQIDQTDWDFLRMRAREIGYEFGLGDGKFYFRKSSSAMGSTGLPVKLLIGTDVLTFAPRVTSGNLAAEVEVRVWDSSARKVVASQHPIVTKSATLLKANASNIANTFSGAAVPGAPEVPPGPSVGNLGPAPSQKAFVVNDRPLATGSSIDSAVSEVVAGVADHLASSFATASGLAVGNPKICPGAAIEIAEIPDPFSGTWIITSAAHVFDDTEGGYRTHFRVDGRQQRSLLGLTTGGAEARGRPSLPGVCCGVVTNNNDPTRKGNVKVALPWLSPQYESDWAPVVQFGAGPRSGAMFLPEVGDEVLVAFEFGDSRRPYVIGGLLTQKSEYSLGGPAVKPSGMAASVVRRGFVSSAGNALVFNDELPPGEGSGPPLTSSFSLGTGDGNLALVIDQVAGTIALTCKPAPPASRSPAGQVTIECGDLGTLNLQTGSAGTINIKAGEGGSVNIDGGVNLSMKAQAMVEIESQGVVSIKGSAIKLN
ncbi:MAG TPA: phage baseplate assembly protein V [Mycobacteriales bacterium]|nr:phage baseplate assembly protein V [Mycobacteriales bacterium]